MRHVLLLVVCLAFVTIATPALAQDSGIGIAAPGEEEALQSGGEAGTQFPEGTTNCSGDRNHHAHGDPANPCVRKNNPHFATKLGGGAPCAERAKHCNACYNCCGLQRTESERCHCFESRCRDALREVQRTCYHSCVGQWIETCGPVPPID